jgi:hypothetical protein
MDRAYMWSRNVAGSRYPTERPVFYTSAKLRICDTASASSCQIYLDSPATIALTVKLTNTAGDIGCGIDTALRLT